MHTVYTGNLNLHSKYRTCRVQVLSSYASRHRIVAPQTRAAARSSCAGITTPAPACTLATSTHVKGRSERSSILPPLKTRMLIEPRAAAVHHAQVRQHRRQPAHLQPQPDLKDGVSGVPSIVTQPPSFQKRGAYRAVEAGSSSSIMRRCDHTGARLLAHIRPLAAAAGTPMPGIVESPHTYSPGMGVLGPGQPAPSRALMAGP